ncbi:MAG: aldehyde ferredoxin oxidoreductase family protein [Anaerolineales bacterium]
MRWGYTGKLLRVNLSEKKVSVEEPDEGIYRHYLGGRGFIVYYLLKELEPGVAPLSPKNKLVFAVGPVTGLPIAGAGRYAVGGKSPITGGFGESESGGFFGVEMKNAGYDILIIEGRSPSPVYLFIQDGAVEFYEALHLWGAGTAEIEETIQRTHGDKRIRVAAIGLGGEKLVRFASIMNDVVHAASRTGMGAVMGSKNLKAIAVRGNSRVKAADPDMIAKWAKKLREDNEETKILSTLGTASATIHHGKSGNLPVRNFQDGVFEGLEKINGKAMAERFRKGADGCYACYVRCDQVADGKTKWGEIDPRYGGPEYETVGALGSCCGVDDLSAIVKGNELCNKYGLDTISCGVTIAFAMECYERGIISTKDTDGIDLCFGNADAMLTMIQRIASREGFGKLLAEGSLRAAQAIGNGAFECVMHVKGLEIPMHDPRYKKGLGLGMAVNPAGPDHACLVHDTSLSSAESVKRYSSIGIFEAMPPTELSPRKVAAIYKAGLQYHLSNILAMCIFLPYGLEGYRETINAATGWSLTDYELVTIAERAMTLARIFNLREGFTSDDDALPTRFQESQNGGPLESEIVDPEIFQEAKELLYVMLGWDSKTGVPTRGHLVELGIEWATPFVE